MDQFASVLHEVPGPRHAPRRQGTAGSNATQRCEVSRLRDTNEDGRADVFETVGDPWGISGDYHEYAFGSKFDKDGNMFVVLCLTVRSPARARSAAGASRFRTRWKMDADLRRRCAHPAASLHADGDLFYTDNQGPWNGADKLQQLIPGRFVGNPEG
jgi:hypothetical protein